MRFVPAFVVAGVLAIGAPFGCAFDTTGGADPPGVDPDPDPDPDPGDPGADVHADGGVPDPAVATAFRLTEIALRDPHMYAFSGGFGGGCDDITDGGGNSVNSRIAALLSGDADDDGYLDRGVILVFRPFSDEVGAAPLEISNARCTAPAETTKCAVLDEPVATLARNIGADACDVPSAQTVTGYTPPIDVAVAPCFASDAVDFELGLEVPIPESEFVVSATISPDGKQLTGVLRGFVSESDADVVELIGTAVMSRFLPGGEGACTVHDARDVSELGESGWYAYFNFTAEVVPLEP